MMLTNEKAGRSHTAVVIVMQTNEELWAETAQRLTDEVQQIIEFAKFVPGFINLLQDDQIMLLKGGQSILSAWSTVKPLRDGGWGETNLAELYWGTGIRRLTIG